MSARFICGYDSKTIYISLHLLFVTVIILLSLFINLWVSQGQYDSFWKGSLFELSTGLEQFNSMEYDQISKVYCSVKQREEISNDLFELYSSRCEMFYNLHLAGLIYIFFEVFTMASALAWITVGLYFSPRIQKLNYLYYFGIIPIVTHSLGYYLWSGIAKISIASSCKNSHDGIRSAVICGEFSAYLAYGLVILNGVVVTAVGIYIGLGAFFRRTDDNYTQAPLTGDKQKAVNI
jgi:hypothetical protein